MLALTIFYILDLRKYCFEDWNLFLHQKPPTIQVSLVYFADIDQNYHVLILWKALFPTFHWKGWGYEWNWKILEDLMKEGFKNWGNYFILFINCEKKLSRNLVIWSLYITRMILMNLDIEKKKVLYLLFFFVGVENLFFYSNYFHRAVTFCHLRSLAPRAPLKTKPRVPVQSCLSVLRG